MCKLLRIRFINPFRRVQRATGERVRLESQLAAIQAEIEKLEAKKPGALKSGQMPHLLSALGLQREIKERVQEQLLSLREQAVRGSPRT